MVLNVSRHRALASRVAEAELAADTLIDLMQMFRDKQSIFSQACELLCILSESSQLIKVRNRAVRCYCIASNNTVLNLVLFLLQDECNSAEFKKRLDSIVNILERKQRLDVRVRNVNYRPSMATPCTSKMLGTPGPSFSVSATPQASSILATPSANTSILGTGSSPVKGAPIEFVRVLVKLLR